MISEISFVVDFKIYFYEFFFCQAHKSEFRDDKIM